MIKLESETFHENPKSIFNAGDWKNNGVITSGETFDELLENINSCFLDDDIIEKLSSVINSEKNQIFKELKKEGNTTIYTPLEREFAFLLRYEED